MENRLPIRISLVLILAVAVAYFPVVHCDFINFDDGDYVYNNPHIKTGLTRANLVWAWTNFYAANWHPLTWMAHQLDCQLFDLRPRPHHLVNLGWHVANTVILFLVLRRLTGEDWRPALVAALFGLHPLHVESVAWVSERKDVLSTFFAFVTLAAYTFYVERPSVRRYLIVMASFVLGLLCKPMLVTWPFVLLLMDYWPLRRLARLSLEQTKRDSSFAHTVGWLVLEKLPLLALAAASSVVTMRAQALAMKPSEHLAWGFRLANAVLSYATYLRKMVWPVDLAVFYRHEGSRLTWPPVVISGAVLVLLSLLVLLGYRRRPAWLVGWLWYLGTLVPVIGLVQVGLQSMADRYTYIPLIGIFLALAWSIPDLSKGRFYVGWTVSGIVVICGVGTFRQTLFWRSSEELWARAVAAADNPISRCYYARALVGKAGELYSQANELRRKGRARESEHLKIQAKDCMAQAEQQCRVALHQEPSLELACAQLGEYRIFRNDLNGAQAVFSEGVALNPQSAGLHNRLGRVLAYKGQTTEACRHFREACRWDRKSAALFFDLGTALAQLGDREEAERQWAIARELEPDYDEQLRTYAESFLSRPDERRYCPAAAVFHAQEACWSSQKPRAELYQTLAESHAAAGHPLAAYLAAQYARGLAEKDGRTNRLAVLRQLTRSYESSARLYGGRVAAATMTGPLLASFVTVVEALTVQGLDSAEYRSQGDLKSTARHR